MTKHLFPGFHFSLCLGNYHFHKAFQYPVRIFKSGRCFYHCYDQYRQCVDAMEILIVMPALRNTNMHLFTRTGSMGPVQISISIFLQTRLSILPLTGQEKKYGLFFSEYYDVYGHVSFAGSYNLYCRSFRTNQLYEKYPVGGFDEGIQIIESDQR